MQCTPSACRVLANPKAGRGRASRLVERLQAESRLDLRTPNSADALAREASQAVAEGVERVIVVGGDGSLHQAIRGLAGTTTALGIVPVGTGNDLARALGLPLDPDTALEIALHGTLRTMDLGRVNGLPFAGIAALGLDSEVLEFMQRHPHRLQGSLAYAYAVLRTLMSFHAPQLRIETEETVIEGPAMLAAVANAPVFGGGMHVAPDAVLDDGWLDLVIIEPMSTLRALWLLSKVYRGQHIGHPRVSHRRVRQVTLFSDRTLTTNGDGEPLAETGAAGTRVEVWPRALRVVGP